LLEIVNVLPGSTAARLGLQSGDSIVSVNGEDINDVIDFQFSAADERVRLVVQKQDGTKKTLTIDKKPDDNLGLGLSPLRIKRCRNKCIFCFVDQMPAGCRKSLYIKDDDFRASFLYGNYITLGALSESDWTRIFRQRLSPLYISVHATESDLRAFILNNKKASDIMSRLKRLAAGGIRMHTQIVLSPGINDGPHLLKTVEDLAGLFPAVSSIAVVPVGLTAFRKGLFPLKPFTRREARSVIEDVKPLEARYKKQFGTRLVFASDEFYIKAGVPVPPASFYEDFPQRENGVGMVAEFLRDVSRTRLPAKLAPIRVTLVTGVSFSSILKKISVRLNKIEGVSLSQITVKNRFFGPAVTVAGLLTGGDILHALRGRQLGDMVLIPGNALKDEEDVFLDGMRLDQLKEKLAANIHKVETVNEMLAWLGGKRRR
jgi:putative radical SAM enzyme (TIGR03279 family)